MEAINYTYNVHIYGGIKMTGIKVCRYSLIYFPSQYYLCVLELALALAMELLLIFHCDYGEIGVQVTLRDEFAVDVNFTLIFQSVESRKLGRVICGDV